MAFNARKLEIVLKEVNADLVKEGVLTERVTQDIWTKLMSNLTQVPFFVHFKYDKFNTMKQTIKYLNISVKAN